uniref:Uncharacterized protein n=1 Tax=Phocoena sinus TaxID=42100 RepID=A0A8C9BU45_PHOSS
MGYRTQAEGLTLARSMGNSFLVIGDSGSSAGRLVFVFFFLNKVSSHSVRSWSNLVR